MSPEARRRSRYALLGAGALVCIALFVPTRPPEIHPPAGATTFRWDADTLFAALEDELERATSADVAAAGATLRALETEGDGLLAGMGGAGPSARLARLVRLQFELAVLGAAHPELLVPVQAFLVRARRRVMDAATRWPADRATHEALYRVVFGGRVALDEALVQAGSDALPALIAIEDVPSASPSIVVEGVRVHSGDILLSRGGAPTSALIARGNDFANTFSHAALAHVDADTGVGTVVESLIEAGSVRTSVEEYLASKKHRILVLRLRPDHPAVLADPLVAHRAAESMLKRVRAGHIPYDFAMDWRDPEKAFCSEIVYHAYRESGIELWPLRSSISSPGLVRWLTAMGVRELTSLVPSDAEYDPQLRAVVEWRDAPALMDYRLDNAVIDALLEEAERGGSLGYAWYALPAARMLKGYSVVRSWLGHPPIIPQGMSASTALRVDALIARVHPVVKEDLTARAEAFHRERGYPPPYWALVELAREALDEQRAALVPALTRRRSPDAPASVP